MNHAFSAIVLAVMAAMLTVSPFSTAHSPSEHARVYFIGLEDGAVVKCPIKVKFGVEGYGIVPAGIRDKRRHTGGHYHLLVDVKEKPALDEPIPRDVRHIHLDGGERETVLDLPPGEHTLQLLLGDEEHESLDPPLISKKIHITVEE